MRGGIRIFVGALFLVLQLGAIVYAQFTPRRYFCWAPNDYAIPYSLQVSVEGRQLSDDQARARYHIDKSRARCYENPASHIVDSIQQYEQTYGRNDRAQVLLKWRRDGRDPEYQWHWPEQ